MNQLKVGYPYYQNFSKWLKRQSLKHMAGETRASRVILDKIRGTILSKRDIDICLGFNSEYITGAVLSNSLIKPLTTYKLLIQKKLYKDKYYLKQFTSKNNILSKVKIRILERLNKDYENKEQLDWKDLIESLYNKNDTVPALPVVFYITVKSVITNQGYYTWSSSIDWNKKIRKISSGNILKYSKEVLREDIAYNSYEKTYNFFKKINTEYKNMSPAGPNQRQLLKTLLLLLPYIKDEIILNTQYSSTDIYTSEVESLMEHMLQAHNNKLITSKYVMDIIKNMSVSCDDTVSNLIKLIQKEVSQVTDKQSNFKDRVKSIIENE